MRILFFGTPEVAVPFLEVCLRKAEVAGVVTMPDEPAGRGYALRASPVKTAAAAAGRTVLQPAKATDPAFLETIRTLRPDLGVVVAYGKILRPALLSIPAHGFLNVHFSLLPAYRGAAPMQRALMAGERRSGVTLFWLDEGMDTGPVFLQTSVEISPDADGVTLPRQLVKAGVPLLEDALERIARGEIERRPQTGEASLAPPIQKNEARIEWSRPAEAIVNQIRALRAGPAAFTYYLGGAKTRLKVLKATATAASTDSRSPGDVSALVPSQGFRIRCGSGDVLLLDVQPESKREMSAWDFAQGAHLAPGDRFGD